MNRRTARVDDYVNTLSERERVLHETFIRECRESELEVHEVAFRAQAQLVERSAARERLMKRAQELAHSVQFVQQSLGDLSLLVHDWVFRRHCERNE